MVSGEHGNDGATRGGRELLCVQAASDLHGGLRANGGSEEHGCGCVKKRTPIDCAARTQARASDPRPLSAPIRP